ncbi:hypothetical protein Tco_1186617, partial [Tanacetum coccineum]
YETEGWYATARGESVAPATQSRKAGHFQLRLLKSLVLKKKLVLDIGSRSEKVM